MRCGRSHRAPSQAASDAHATIWVKRVNVVEGQYSAKKSVDLEQTVDDFKASWAAEELPSVRPSLITLRLVSRGARKPSVAEEEAAAVLDDPSLSLSDAGVTGGTAWLLASVAGTAAALPGECDVELRIRSLLEQPCECIARRA